MRFFNHLGVVILLVATASVVATRPHSPPFPPHQPLAQNAELPESAVLIALGHDSEAMPLQEFAARVQRQLQRRVVTYRQFESVHYTSETGNWWDRMPFDQATNAVEQAIR